MSVIGIDLGGTKVAGALFEPDGTVLHKVNRLLEKRSGRQVGALVLEVIDTLIANQQTGWSNISAIGVCVPGIANSKTQRVWAPNIPEWDDYPLTEEIAHHIRQPHCNVSVESDRTCYILGEVWKGAARGCNNALFIAVGTGIGVGILIDGTVLHGKSDIVGAAGWMALQPPYRQDYDACGCFETYASGAGIARQAQRMISLLPASSEEGGEKQKYNSIFYTKEVSEITAQDVFAAYQQHDEVAVKVLDKAVEMWGMASANLISLLNPEKIIWGGGVFGPGVQFLNRIYDEATRWAQPVSMRQVEFVPSALGGDAGLYGAAYLANKSVQD